MRVERDTEADTRANSLRNEEISLYRQLSYGARCDEIDQTEVAVGRDPLLHLVEDDPYGAMIGWQNDLWNGLASDRHVSSIFDENYKFKLVSRNADLLFPLLRVNRSGRRSGNTSSSSTLPCCLELSTSQKANLWRTMGSFGIA